jgi:hypothetical protein
LGKVVYYDAPALRPHVVEWLETNVKDRKGDKDCNKGWCVGSGDYNSKGYVYDFTIFFHRKADAMAFIKEFSKYKKPTDYWDYFNCDRKVLNLETLKYEPHKD